MILKYKVSLPGIKGFAREYEVKDNSTLYTLHKQMRSDMDFPQDQIVLFKSVDETGRALSRYASVDLGYGTIDSITMAQLHKNSEDHFVYFYDTTNAKSVLLDFVEEMKTGTAGFYPALVGIKGPNPIEFENGYVAFEDLPEDKKKRLGSDDDWDDEDDDEDSDGDDEDDEPEEIFDENEEQ